MDFSVAFFNVLLALFYMFPGYVVCKMKKASADHLATLSTVLVYICSPCMIVSSFLSMEYSASDLGLMALFFVVSFILQVAFMALLYLILRRHYEDSRYRIFTIATVMGNCGFFGLPVVKALLPDNPEVACYSSIYVVSMNILVFTMGIYCLTHQAKYMTLKAAIFNPSMFGFAIAMPCYLIGASHFLPDLLQGGIDLLGRMTTPLCMLILGIRLATVPFGKIFRRPLVYLICLFKLFIFPIFCFGCVYFFPLPMAFKASMLILAGTPCASVILNLAEMHRSETEISANCVLVSTLLCIFSIPVLTLLV